MDSIKRNTRILFITVCGLLNFIYLSVSTLFVFDKIFDVLLKNKNSFSTLIDFIPRLNNNSGQLVTASMDSIYFLPLYLILTAFGFVTVIMFLYFMVEIPKIAALFYMNRLDVFLFIDKRKTTKFFIMLLLPVTNFVVLKIFSPGEIRADFIESMILCTISHTGVCILLFFIKALKEEAYTPEEKNKLFKIIGANFIRGSLLILTAAFMILPYLLYYHYETDIIWVGTFNFFLVSALISNYKFYKENFIELIEEAD